MIITYRRDKLQEESDSSVSVSYIICRNTIHHVVIASKCIVKGKIYPVFLLLALAELVCCREVEPYIWSHPACVVFAIDGQDLTG